MATAKLFRLLGFVRQHMLLGLVYLILSYFIGEFHPFTKVPMYSSFPNWAYTFYLSDTDDQLLPVSRYFHSRSGIMVHSYNAACSELNIEYGYQAETPKQLQMAGERMWAELEQQQRAPLPASIVRLHRVAYRLQNDSVMANDVVMYEAEL